MDEFDIKNAKAGDRVECIADDWTTSQITPGTNCPQRGKTYTIKRIWEHPLIAIVRLFRLFTNDSVGFSFDQDGIDPDMWWTRSYFRMIRPEDDRKATEHQTKVPIRFTVPEKVDT